MAYSIEFSPEAVDQLRTFPRSMQFKVLNTLEKEAEAITPESNKQKRLRRLHVGDHRLVVLEVHPTQQLLVLKAADPGEVFRRLNNLTPPEPAPIAVDETVEPAEAPVEENTAPKAVASETATGAVEKEERPPSPGPAPETPAASNQPEAQEKNLVGQAVPSLDSLKRNFLDGVLGGAAEYLSPETPVESLKEWVREVAGSGGAFGYFDITKLAREALLENNVDARLEAVARMIEAARAEMAKLAVA